MIAWFSFPNIQGPIKILRRVHIFKMVPESPGTAWIARLVGSIHLERESVDPLPCEPVSFALFHGLGLHI